MGQYIRTPLVNCSFAKYFCRAKDCLNKPALGDLFCSSCLSDRKQAKNNPNKITALPLGYVWIYFIIIDGLEPIKIGKTADIEQRMSSLSVGCPNDLKLLAKFAAPHHVEPLLHAIFSDEHVKGEWFNPCKDLLSMIERINNGNIPDHLFDLDRNCYR
jgi:hypothetical protein